MADFDGLVIGAGHNGLTLAAYLARAGLRIAVLKRNDRIGGGCSTEERILPGYKLNLHANFYMGLGFCPLPPRTCQAPASCSRRSSPISRASRCLWAAPCRCRWRWRAWWRRAAAR